VTIWTLSGINPNKALSKSIETAAK
jgi:hypothetical protein